MPAKVAAQSHCTWACSRPNIAWRFSSVDGPASANSGTNGLPTRTLVTATRRRPTLLPVRSHRSRIDSLSVNANSVSTANVAMAPISIVCNNFRCVRPTNEDATATTSASTDAVTKGTLPTRTQ